jgi:hypothetical protein
MKKAFLIFFFLLSCCAWCKDKTPAVQYDSTVKAEVRNASAEKEKEIFSDKDFEYKADAQESKNWLRAFSDWLTEKLFGKISVENADLTWQIIKWVMIALFIAGIILIIIRSNFRGLLRSAPKNLGGAAFTDIPEDIDSVNIDKLIDEALKNGNYRLAIRWCFLKSLQLLNARQQINWQPAKTNVDYQHELKNPGLRESFSRLSHVFEYVWYGEMTTSESVFTRYKNEMEKFNGSLHA